MRILFFSAFFQGKGHETYLSDEIFTTARMYPKIQFIVYTTNSDKNSITRLTQNILWIERKNLKNIMVIIQFLKEIITIFTKFKPNIIHSTYVLESLIMAFTGKIFRVPTILHGRGTDLNYFPFISLKYNILARLSCKLNKHILTVSKTMKREVMNLGVPDKKIDYIYNGIDFEFFQPKQKKVFSNIDSFKIIHIGRYSPEKCQDLIIEVLKELRDKNYKFNFTLLGFGHKMFRNYKIGYEIKKKIIDLINKYKLNEFVKLEGFVDHEKIPEYLERADLYIQPSLSEGLPNSVLEAMSMELPVIMTKAGGMLELNVKPGVILIEKNNKQQLYDAIVSFLENPNIRKVGGKKNREFIIKYFSWEKHGEKLYNIYLKLIK